MKRFRVHFLDVLDHAATQFVALAHAPTAPAMTLARFANHIDVLTEFAPSSDRKRAVNTINEFFGGMGHDWFPVSGGR